MTAKDYFLILASLTIGFFLGFSIKQLPFISVDPKVDLVAVGNLIAFVIFAVAIPSLLTTRINDRRCEKDLLIDEINQIVLMVNGINELISDSLDDSITKNQFLTISAEFKKIRQSINFLESRTSKSKKLTGMFSCLKVRQMEYWETVTGKNGIKNGGFSVKVSFYNRQHNKYYELMRELKRIKFSINAS